MTLWERIQYEFNKNSSPIRKLILVNVAIFLLASLVFGVAQLYGSKEQAKQLLSILSIPSDFPSFIKKPWTLVTYMFMHSGIRHIAGNMLMLYFLGRILLDFQSNRNFYQIYFGGGLVGAGLYLLVFNLFPSIVGGAGLSEMVGASGAVLSVVVATAVLVPNYEIFLFGAFRLKVKWIAVYLVLADILFFGNGNQGGHLAHIGGALFGGLYILYIQGRIGLNLFRRISNPFKAKYTIVDERDILRQRTVKTEKKSSNSTTGRVNSPHKPRQEEVDAILDKIGQSGYDSLSKEEKDLLFRASE
ncbi:MAG: rhomboid family intramembrane serine protease [Bacteroidia bacterium]|nr:rhomboid family intramembrane serine protease [Bacteroidia bacterium]